MPKQIFSPRSGESLTRRKAVGFLAGGPYLANSDYTGMVSRGMWQTPPEGWDSELLAYANAGVYRIRITRSWKNELIQPAPSLLEAQRIAEILKGFGLRQVAPAEGRRQKQQFTEELATSKDHSSGSAEYLAYVPMKHSAIYLEALNAKGLRATLDQPTHYFAAFVEQGKYNKPSNPTPKELAATVTNVRWPLVKSWIQKRFKRPGNELVTVTIDERDFSMHASVQGLKNEILVGRNLWEWLDLDILQPDDTKIALIVDGFYADGVGSIVPKKKATASLEVDEHDAFHTFTVNMWNAMAQDLGFRKL